MSRKDLLSFPCLFCVVHYAALADDVDLDLSGILEFILDSSGDVVGEDDHLVIVDFFGLDHDADFTAGLNCEGFVNAFKLVGDFL